MRSCLQCRAVTSREGRIWNLHSLLLYSHGRSFDDPRTAHTQDSMIKRERSPSFTFFSPFFWFSLWSRPFRFQRMWRRITSSSFRGRIDPLDGLPLEILCSLLSSRWLPSHLSVLGFRIDIIPFRSNQWTIISHALKAGFSMHQISRDPFAHTLKKEEEKKFK